MRLDAAGRAAPELSSSTPTSVPDPEDQGSKHGGGSQLGSAPLTKNRRTTSLRRNVLTVIARCITFTTTGLPESKSIPSTRRRAPVCGIGGTVRTGASRPKLSRSSLGAVLTRHRHEILSVHCAADFEAIIAEPHRRERAMRGLLGLPACSPCSTHRRRSNTPHPWWRARECAWCALLAVD